MLRLAAVTTMMAMMVGAAASAQGKKPAGTNAVTYDFAIRTEATYTGKMDIAIAKGVATGNMLITSPEEITGTVAGTSNGGELKLDFPYTMVQRNCTGQIQMNIKIPAKPGPATRHGVDCWLRPRREQQAGRDDRAETNSEEVARVNSPGQTAVVARVEASAVRPVTGREITPSRELRAS